MNKLTYFRLEIKRTIKLIPSILLGAAALSIVIGAVAFCGAKMLYSSSTNEKKNLLFVSQDKSKITHMIVNILKDSKSINSVCDIKETDYDTAMDTTQKKDAFASVIIPEGFMNSLFNGTNYSIKIYFSPNASIYNLVLSELCKSAELTLRCAQAGVYALYDYYDSADALDKEDAANKELNVIYLNKVFNRDHIYNEHILTATGDLTVTEFYVASGIMIILLLLGFIFIQHFNSESSILLALYRKYHIGAFLQVLSHIISVFFTVFLIFFSIMFIIFFFLTRVVDKINISGVSLQPLFLNSLIISLFTSCFIVMISNLFFNKNSAIFMTFLSTIIFSFVSGVIIPELLLPHVIGQIGTYLPFKYLHQTIGSIINNEIIIKNMLILLLSSVIFYLIAVIANHVYSLYILKCNCKRGDSL